MTDPFFALAAIVAVIAGATASVVGFGIGSLLTPLLAARYGAELAVAMVALPHAAATVLRASRLRHEMKAPVVLRFGLVSAAGGLTGALLALRLGGPAITAALGALLVLTAFAGLTGWTQRWHPRGPLVWLLAGMSGLFGGLAGNQGGIRAAALSSFGLTPVAFVAASTAAGVLVDAARTPVYLLRFGSEMASSWSVIALLSAGTVAGTLLGERLLFGMPALVFRRVVAGAVGVLGAWLLTRAVSG